MPLPPACASLTGHTALFAGCCLFRATCASCTTAGCKDFCCHRGSDEYDDSTDHDHDDYHDSTDHDHRKDDSKAASFHIAYGNERQPSQTGLCKPQNVYMLGNSVTRHYGFEICELAKSGKSTVSQVLDRKQEQKVCKGILGSSSCELYCGSTAVRFLWKNTLSLSPSAAGRDACKGQLPGSTSACLSTQLNGAQSMDLLVVGSVARGWRDGGQQLGDFLPRCEEALNHTNFPQLLRMLHDVFPGLIIWQSYPFVLRERDNYRRVLPEHVEGIRRMNARTEKAIKSFQEGYATACDARILFDDFWPLQVKHADMYQDAIHHPGPLSSIIVQQFMDQWTHHAGSCE